MALYLVGYALACIVFVAGTGWFLSRLYASSRLMPRVREQKQIPLVNSRAIISFSIILPFAALSLLLLTFTPMKIAQSLNREGHLLYVISSLTVPILGFFIGYFYFKKAVKP